jgi:hypothetical protein
MTGALLHPRTPNHPTKTGSALCLPFVVGPHGFIGKLNAKALAP